MKTYISGFFIKPISGFFIKLAVAGIAVFGHLAAHASELNIYSHRQAFISGFFIKLMSGFFIKLMSGFFIKLAVAGIAVFGHFAAHASELNIYSHRQAFMSGFFIKPISGFFIKLMSGFFIKRMSGFFIKLMSGFFIKLAVAGIAVFGHLAAHASELNIYSHRQAFMSGFFIKRMSGFFIKLAVAGIAVFGHFAAHASELNIYSHRQAFLITPFLDAFTAETGIKTNVVFASKGLAQRLAAEGANSPADLVLTVDIARLSVYAEKGLFAPVQSDILNRVIPQHLRSQDGTWFGLSKRSRIVGVSKDRVADGAVLRIEDLADPKWRGKICSRPGSHVYNRALVASMIAAHGEVKAEAWARDLVANFARRPQGNDRAQVKAIFEGQCDIAILNHYYYGKLLTSDDAAHRQWADSINVVFPNQGADDRGAHVNISGGGIAIHSKNKGDAQRLLEFLVSEKAQSLYAKINYEYPVDESLDIPEELKLWGTFKEDQTPISEIARLSVAAQKIIDRVGW